MSDSQSYAIVKSQHPLVGGVAGHNFIAVLTPEGNVIHELNGLATSRTGEIKPIGYLPSDKLYIYDEVDVGKFFYNSSQNQEIIFSGSYREVMDKFQIGKYLIPLFNSKNFSYPFIGLGDNSNSAASTLLKGMGLPDPDLGNAITPGEGAY
ncbi:hypothetical protein [Neisseria iguanae]|nr:hypothetical protein [Neisseria iguanae]